MSYSLVIEGTQGGRKIRHGAVPHKGEWLGMELEKSWWWLPVVEVGHVLSEEESLKEPEAGCDRAHEKAECLVFSSLAMAVRVDPQSKDESFKLILPPTRWPYGGRLEDGNGFDRVAMKN